MRKAILDGSRSFLWVIGLLVVFAAVPLLTYGQTNDDKLPGTLWTGSIRKDAYTSLFLSFDFGKGKTVKMTIADSKTRVVKEINGTYLRNKEVVTLTFPKITIENAEVYQDCLGDKCMPAEMIGVITLTPGEPKYHFHLNKQVK